MNQNEILGGARRNYCACCAAPVYSFVWAGLGFIISMTYIIMAGATGAIDFHNVILATCFILSCFILILNFLVVWHLLLTNFRKLLSFTTVFRIVCLSICLVLLSMGICLITTLAAPNPHKKCGFPCTLISVIGFFIVILPFLFVLLIAQFLLAFALQARNQKEKDFNLHVHIEYKRENSRVSRDTYREGQV